MRDRILFVASAVLAGIAFAAIGWSQTRVAPEQIRLPRISKLMACCPATDSAGVVQEFYYLDVVTPSGTELKLIAVPAPAVDVTTWAPVP